MEKKCELSCVCVVVVHVLYKLRYLVLWSKHSQIFDLAGGKEEVVKRERFASAQREERRRCVLRDVPRRGGGHAPTKNTVHARLEESLRGAGPTEKKRRGVCAPLHDKVGGWQEWRETLAVHRISCPRHPPRRPAATPPSSTLVPPFATLTTFLLCTSAPQHPNTTQQRCLLAATPWPFAPRPSRR